MHWRCIRATHWNVSGSSSFSTTKGPWGCRQTADTFTQASALSWRPSLRLRESTLAWHCFWGGARSHSSVFPGSQETPWRCEVWFFGCYGAYQWSLGWGIRRPAAQRSWLEMLQWGNPLFCSATAAWCVSCAGMLVVLLPTTIDWSPAPPSEFRNSSCKKPSERALRTYWACSVCFHL